MARSRWSLAIYTGFVLAIGGLVGSALARGIAVKAQVPTRVFELRTYTANEGMLDALQARFRDHTLRLFEKHGMTNIGYWAPQDPPLSENTLVYILAHRDRRAAEASWAAFSRDPEWRRVSAESQRQGRLVSSVESVFMEATDYSPMK